MGNKRNSKRSVGKKRKFYGNRFTKPIVNKTTETASERKLSKIPINDVTEVIENNVESQDTFQECSGNRIINLSNLKSLFDQLLCPSCLSSCLHLSEDSVFGLSSNLSLKCKECAFTTGICTSKKDGQSAEINTSFVFGLRVIGQGYSSAVKLCSALDMKCMSKTTFHHHEKKLMKVTSSTAKEMVKTDQEVACLKQAKEQL